MTIQIYRSSILHFIKPPTPSGDGVEYFKDGALIVSEGRILECDHFTKIEKQLSADLSNNAVVDYSDKLLMPGFIDTHIHFPQLDVIASYGEQLLDWLNNYTFMAEQRFAIKEYAEEAAESFIDELLRNGTTTAMTYATVHPQSVDAFFAASTKRNTRMIAGKVMMDRNAPNELMDTAESSYHQSKNLIKHWHDSGRQKYALTPRFAPTSSPTQLDKVGKLMREFDGVYMQTHLSESIEECAWVKELYPDRKSYLDVYDHFGLLSERSIFGHCIHLHDNELSRLNDTGSGVAFCPTSNLFLGSGLFNFERAKSFNVNLSLASDVGAGTSFSQLQTLSEAYKVCQLQEYSLHPYEAFYWLTMGNAKTLGLDNKIGNFELGKEADFVVLDPMATQLLKYRRKQVSELWEILFLLMTLGDDRVVEHTYIAGQLSHSK